MIDFNELPVDGKNFEILIREMLLCEGLEVHWTGVGPDDARDLIVSEHAQGNIGDFKRKWVVQCKHNAHSKKSVGEKDIEISDTCDAVDAKGYLLACTTQPSASLVKKFEGIENKKGIKVKYWDAIEIEKRLLRPKCFHLIEIFFPISSKAIGWNIYNVGNPSLWAAHYKEYFFYLSARTSHEFPDLKQVEKIIEIVDSFPKIDKRQLMMQQRLKSKSFPEYLRLRNVFFDNKNCNFHVSIDYLVEQRSQPEIKGIEFEYYFNNKHNNVEGITVFWEIYLIKADFSSDYFDCDSKEYYEPYLYQFLNGQNRPYNELNLDEYYMNDPIVRLIKDGLTPIRSLKNEDIDSGDYPAIIVKILEDNYGRINIIDLYKTIWYEYEKEYILKEDNDSRAYLWQYFVGNAINELRQKGVIEDDKQTPEGIIQLS